MPHSVDLEPSGTEPALRVIGKTLRQLRRERGLTQQELGRRAGLDRSYLGGVERGERNLSILALVRILGALRVSWSELAAAIDAGQG